MSNAPKIAVVVPIYNSESYLKECIESITNQTYKNITIFCIDDGSTDKSRDVIKKIKEEDPRIYLRTIKNSGVSVARNTALELINKSGAFDFVSFVDSDDLLDLEFYETAIKLLSKTKADFCALGVRSLGPNNNITPNEQNIDPYKLESNIDILKHFTAKLAGSTQYTDSSAQRILANKIFSYKIIKDKKFTVYTLGRTCVQKQPELFNEIAQLVPEARFVWIGGGELDYLLTAPNLELTGWKPRHEALAMGKGADVFILCSLGEAIAMSLIENMYMGKLILVSNVMGNKSVIQNGRNGYVCDTAKDYADKIKEAMKNYPKELCEQAIKDVHTIYNTHVMANKYVKFYNNAIAGQYK